MYIFYLVSITMVCLLYNTLYNSDTPSRTSRSLFSPRTPGSNDHTPVARDRKNDDAKPDKKGISKIANMSLDKKTIAQIKKYLPQISFPNAMTYKEVIQTILNSNMTHEEKMRFPLNLVNMLLSDNDTNKLDKILHDYHLQEHESLQAIFQEEEQKISEEQRKKEEKKVKKQLKKEDSNTDPVQDFLNEPVADIPEIRNRYYQNENERFIPNATTISDLLDQIVEKMHDPKYAPYKHLLRNAAEDLHRIISGHYTFSSKPKDAAKDKKYFSDKNPAITETTIHQELNNRLETYKDKNKR